MHKTAETDSLDPIPLDPDLAALVEAWPKMPPSVKAALECLVVGVTTPIPPEKGKAPSGCATHFFDIDAGLTSWADR